MTDKIDELIRDATKVGSISKSEFSRRLGEILNDYQCYVMGIKEWRAYGERYGYWDYFKEECEKGYKAELREKLEGLKRTDKLNYIVPSAEVEIYNEAINDVLEK